MKKEVFYLFNQDISKMIKDGITLNVYGPDGTIVKTAKTVEGKNKLSLTAKTSILNSNQL